MFKPIWTAASQPETRLISFLASRLDFGPQRLLGWKTVWLFGFLSVRFCPHTHCEEAWRFSLWSAVGAAARRSRKLLLLLTVTRNERLSCDCASLIGKDLATFPLEGNLLSTFWQDWVRDKTRNTNIGSHCWSRKRFSVKGVCGSRSAFLYQLQFSDQESLRLALVLHHANIQKEPRNAGWIHQGKCRNLENGGTKLLTDPVSRSVCCRTSDENSLPAATAARQNGPEPNQNILRRSDRNLCMVSIRGCDAELQQNHWKHLKAAEFLSVHSAGHKHVRVS